MTVYAAPKQIANLLRGTVLIEQSPASDSLSSQTSESSSDNAPSDIELAEAGRDLPTVDLDSLDLNSDVQLFIRAVREGATIWSSGDGIMDKRIDLNSLDLDSGIDEHAASEYEGFNVLPRLTARGFRPNSSAMGGAGTAPGNW